MSQLRSAKRYIPDYRAGIKIRSDVENPMTEEPNPNQIPITNDQMPGISYLTQAASSWDLALGHWVLIGIWYLGHWEFALAQT
jgi:hypothetical protein